MMADAYGTEKFLFTTAESYLDTGAPHDHRPRRE